MINTNMTTTTIEGVVVRTLSSYDFWKVINGYREDAGERKVQHNHFRTKLEKECDDLGGCKYFTPVNGGSSIKYYTINEDQMFKVGMRESKAVRDRVLALVRKLEAEVATQPAWISNLSPEAHIALADLSNQVAVKNVQIEDLSNQVELGVKEVDRILGVCKTVTAQFAAGLTVPCLCKSFNGVNTQQVNNKLLEMGRLRETKYGIEPTSYTRDRYFTLTYGVYNDIKKAKVTLTLEGAQWLYRAYLADKLPMKANWNGKKVHVEFEVK